MVRLCSIAEVTLPPAPPRFFASDNFSPVHPRYMEAIAEANEGHQFAYGGDPFTKRATEMFRELCGMEVETLFDAGDVAFEFGGEVHRVASSARFTAVIKQIYRPKARIVKRTRQGAGADP